MARTYPLEISVEGFAANTPSVPAERIDCEHCGQEYIGDPADEARCPQCCHDAGIDPATREPVGGSQ